MRQTDYRSLYDRLSPVYAWMQRLIPLWRYYVARAVPPLPEEGICLEIGHGPGLLLTELARQGWAVAGVDVSWGMVQRARTRLLRAGFPSLLVQGDAAHLPYAACTFSGVVMTFAFSAIPNGLAVMREVERVLRAGGIFSLVDAGIAADRNLGSRALAWLWTLFGDLMRDEAELMRAAGFEVLNRREFGAFHGIRLVVGRKPVASSNA